MFPQTGFEPSQLEERTFTSSMLYHWAIEASNQLEQDLDFKWIYPFSVKILKQKRDFRYRYRLLQKIKNVLIICEYNFDFLQKYVPITEIPEIAIHCDFSTVFWHFWKFLLNALYKHAFFYMIESWRVVLTYTIAFYTYQSTFLSKKLNVEEKLTARPSPTVHNSKSD